MRKSVDRAVHRTPAILIVDDEFVVTQSLAAFLELETDYKILTFQSPAEALLALRDSNVDLVIADFLMPDMNGLEFLTEVKKLYPDVPRIMLTGYADKENSIRAINEVGLFQYIEKPWDNDQFRLVIENALSNKSLREKLNRRILELDSVLRERERLMERDELLREELVLAQRLQRGMLPERLPDDGRLVFSAEYLPALEIGGDFYDVLPVADNKLAVLVADVTGHGIQAALSTALLKFAFSGFTNCDCTPSQIISGMNTVLLRALPSETFAAALVAIVDLKTAEVRLGNAGLPHPFVLHRRSSDAERVVANGFMLGIIEEELFSPGEEHTLRLESGDALVVYTDGISEVQNDAGAAFDSFLKEQIVTHADHTGIELSKKLVAASKRFSRGGHAWDDITIFGIECK